MHTTKSKEAIYKDYILYDSNQATLWKKQHYGVKRSVVSSSLWRERNRWSAGDIQDDETVLYLVWGDDFMTVCLATLNEFVNLKG